jgi:hypothetical protein
MKQKHWLAVSFNEARLIGYMEISKTPKKLNWVIISQLVIAGKGCKRFPNSDSSD